MRKPKKDPLHIVLWQSINEERRERGWYFIGSIMPILRGQFPPNAKRFGPYESNELAVKAARKLAKDRGFRPSITQPEGTTDSDWLDTEGHSVR